MAKFRFRLATLLRLREMEEERSKRTLYEVHSRYQEKEKGLDELVLLREEAKQTNRGPVDGVSRLDVESLLVQRRYINHLYQRIVEKGEELRKLAVSVSDARKELARARTQRRVVEKLKERRKREFDEEQDRKEARELDEMAQVYRQFKGVRTSR